MRRDASVSALSSVCVAAGLALIIIIQGVVQPAGAQTVADVVVTGAAPASCPVTARLVELFAAINAGEDAAEVVDEYFGRARGARLQWLSVNPARDSEHGNFAGSTWRDIERYLDQRYTQNERLELRAIQFNRQVGNQVHFGPIEVVRWADDLPAPRYRLAGKGAYDCDSKAFVALSLGTAEADHVLGVSEDDTPTTHALPPTSARPASSPFENLTTLAAVPRDELTIPPVQATRGLDGLSQQCAEHPVLTVLAVGVGMGGFTYLMLHALGDGPDPEVSVWRPVGLAALAGAGLTATWCVLVS